MSLLQFWKIVWARRWFVLAATISCMLGAYVVTLVVPPRWDAHARVLLNLLKPDPVTGEILGGPATRTYVASQVEMVEDYSVAGLAVDHLGWLTEPVYIAQYRSRSPNDHRDFRRWLAQFITDRTKAAVVEGSNILEITYTGTSPDSAREAAEALRQAYLDTSLSLRRGDATRNADWFNAQALKAKVALDVAESSESNYERANDVYMANGTTDVDSARLAAMASQSAPVPLQQIVGSSSASRLQLAEIDAEIAQMSQTLGPNHPQLQALRAKRVSLQAIVAQERTATVMPSGTRSALDAQAAIVSAKHDKLARLRQLQAEVDLRRDLYNKTATRAAELRQQAAAGDAGLTPLGAAIVPAAPTFPNMPLIIFGSLGLGLAMGILIGLLVELLNRRIRGYDDLQFATGAPLLGVVVAPPTMR